MTTDLDTLRAHPTTGENDMSTETHILVTAEILPGKPDPSAEARFANYSRAQQYVMMLLATGDYSGFWLDGFYRSSCELRSQ